MLKSSSTTTSSANSLLTILSAKLRKCCKSPSPSLTCLRLDTENFHFGVWQKSVGARSDSNWMMTVDFDKKNDQPLLPAAEINELKAEVIANLESNDDELRISACSQLSWLLDDFRSIDLSSEGFISGIVPRLLEILDRDDYPKIQLAAAKAIAKISHRSSENIHLIEQGAVPIMALEVLEMIASVSAESRDLVLRHGVLMPLLEEFNDKTKPSMMEQATRTLSKLCMRKPRFEQVKSAILPLAHLFYTDDGEFYMHACEALFNLTCGEMDMKQAVIDAGVFPRLFELLLYRESFISSPALRIVGNIISYVDDTQTQNLMGLEEVNVGDLAYVA
ncbi:unnamed protein product [Fraxinus pennsylvanica]|uniref:ARM repeat superfamily protein n=1 Tax=Fraxinus pennsylvanica TaxID=56036 RepID=A0AAD2A4J3_9LAMI|nr:unnamed protein product [Fraxinus pennsylvanica]